LSSGWIAWTATPLPDLKPYFASTDSAPDASVGWHATRKR
jgi:tRNA (Thr-GGU) A37 N-methylase